MTSILFFCFARRLFASRLFNSNAMYFTRLKGALKWCKKIMFLVQSRINLSLSFVLVVRDNAHFLGVGGCLGGSLGGVAGGGCDALMSGKTSMDPHGVDL